VLTFVKEMGEHFGSKRPQVFGFIDSLEAVDIASPGLEFLEDTYFWEAFPRYAQKDQSPHDKAYRKAVGVDENGAATGDPKDVSTYSHMFGCWETLYVIKHAVEESGYQSATDKDKKALIEVIEAMTAFEEGPEHPQGAKQFNGKLHQCFGQQVISKVEGQRLTAMHRTSIEDGLYEPEGDYTTQPL
jgi:branched-chain amino acid transport system substrate-binding protein